jgi:hypothetical protein
MVLQYCPKPLAFRYWPAVGIARDQSLALTRGACAELVCWDVMPNGRLRHSLFLR